MDALTIQAIKLLKGYRGILTRQQLQTLKGQALAGDPEGAVRGLRTILIRRGKSEPTTRQAAGHRHRRQP